MPVGKRGASLHVPRGQFERCRQQNTGSSNWRWQGCLFRAGLSPGPSLAEGGNPITHRSTINPRCVERFRNRRRTVRKDVRTQKRSRNGRDAVARQRLERFARGHMRAAANSRPLHERAVPLGVWPHSGLPTPPRAALCLHNATSHSSRSVDSLASHRPIRREPN